MKTLLLLALLVVPQWQPPKFSYGELVVVFQGEESGWQDLGRIRQVTWSEGFYGRPDHYCYSIELEGGRQEFISARESALAKARWLRNGRVAW